MGLIFGVIAAAGASATIASDAFMNPFDGTYLYLPYIAPPTNPLL